MKKYQAAIIVILFLSTAFVHNASASCAPSTLEENYESADFVIRGTAISAESSIIKGEYYEFSVDKYFKGEGPSQLKVTGKQSRDAETSVDFKIEEGQRYLLFLRGETGDILKTDICSGSREVSAPLSRDEVYVLGNGKAPQYEKAAPGLLDNFTLATVTLVVLSGIGIAVFFLRKEVRGRHIDKEEPDVKIH